MKSATKETLLTSLPAYQDKWVLVHPDQSVKDIINEVLQAHSEFAPYYEEIALYFSSDDIEEICTNLYRFCKKNFRYREETEDEQTTASPQGLLTWGSTRGVDCKHFSGFCGGVLDALNRTEGKNIQWNYRFASYNVLNRIPHHVFIVVNDDGVERWIDPTPGAQEQTPVWMVDKTVKTQSMALHRNIGALHRNISGIDHAGVIGLVVSSNTNVDNINYDGSGRYANAFGPHLGLTAYSDFENSFNTNWTELAATINQQIAQGPNPGHTVTPAFVQWVFDSNLRSWNFYFPGGVAPGFADHINDLLPADWPRPVVTEDGRLTFDRDVEIDDYRNAEVHLLTAALQDLINRFDAVPYPIKPRNVKLFSQEHHYGNPGDTNANLFSERRATSDLTKSLYKINKWVNVAKAGVLKVVGSIPRNAFLGLVGLNVFGMANDLQGNINQGKWGQMAKIWKGLGGNPDKFYSTIAHGATRQPVQDASQTVEENTVSGACVGAVQIAAILAAAAPIIAAFMQFLNKQHAGLQSTSQTYVERLNAANPGHTFSYAADGTLLMDGAPVETTGDHTFRNAAIAAGVSLLTFYAANKKRTGRKKILLPAAAGVGTFFAMQMISGSQHTEQTYNEPGPIATEPKTGFTANELLGIVQTGLDMFSQDGGSSTASTDYALPIDTTGGWDTA